MSTHLPITVSLGDLIVTIFDVAGQFTTDSREASELATGAITSALRRAQPPVRVIPLSELRLFRTEATIPRLHDKDCA